jgi:hypothetical protein
VTVNAAAAASSGSHGGGGAVDSWTLGGLLALCAGGLRRQRQSLASEQGRRLMRRTRSARIV